MGMKGKDERYANGQVVSEQNGDTLTYYFEDGTIKAQGQSVDGIMRGRWIFNKKEGYLWQVGHFDDDGQKHGSWTRYNPDGSVQVEQHFAHGKRTKGAT
jgi:antitoxin component YwqK of YwqJK toxin-antitoxin module